MIASPPTTSACDVLVFSGHRHLRNGGVATHLRLLLRELSRRGVSHEALLGKSTAVSLLHRGTLWLKRQCGAPSGETATLFEQVDFLTARLERWLARRASTRPLIVHCHDRYCVLAALNLRDRHPFQIVQTVHAPFAEQYQAAVGYGISNNRTGRDALLHDIAETLEERTNRAGTAMIAVDNLQRDIIHAATPDVPVTVISNAVDIEELDALHRQPRRPPVLWPYVVVARFLQPKNGVHVAIQAFAEWTGRGNRRLVILGEGVELPNLQRLAERLGIADHVLFQGAVPRDAALQYIRHADVSLVPSVPVGRYIEATSLTALESLGLGIPLIASRIGGLSQILEGTGAGVLIEPGQPAALAAALHWVTTHPAEVRTMTGRAQQLTRQHYSTTPWIERIMKVYDGALPGAAAAARAA